MAIPMIPMDPAKDTRIVRAIFVRRLLKESESAVRKDMEARPMFLWTAGADGSGSKGSLSDRITPSRRLTIRVA